MNIAILGATEFELKLLRFTVHGSWFTVKKIGINPKNAENTIKNLIQENHHAFVIICGLCGGLQENLKIGDIIISDSFVNGTEKIEAILAPELKNTIFDIAKKSKLMYHYGSTLTVEKALLSSQEKSNAGKKYSALAVEMENFPIAKVCKEKNIPMISIRAVSDNVRENLDPRFFYLIDPQGNIRKRKLFKYLINDPFFIVSLIKIGKTSKKARKNYSYLIQTMIAKFGATGFEPATPASRTQCSSQAEPRPEVKRIQSNALTKN